MIRAFVLLLGLTSFPWALVKSNLHETNKLKVTFSSKDTNRVVIDNSRIAQIFGVEDVLDYQFDEVNGQCFVKLKQNPGHPITVTLVSEEGETQSLEVSFAEVPSESVILHSLKKEQKADSKRDNVGRQEEQKAVEVIKNILCGKALKGFEVQSTPAKEWQMKEAEVHQAFSNGKLMVVVYYLKNTTQKTQSLSPSQMCHPRDVAIYSSHSVLQPGMTCKIIRVMGGQNGSL